MIRVQSEMARKTCSVASVGPSLLGRKTLERNRFRVNGQGTAIHRLRSERERFRKWIEGRESAAQNCIAGVRRTTFAKLLGEPRGPGQRYQRHTSATETATHCVQPGTDNPDAQRGRRLQRQQRRDRAVYDGIGALQSGEKEDRKHAEYGQYCQCAYDSTRSHADPHYIRKSQFPACRQWLGRNYISNLRAGYFRSNRLVLTRSVARPAPGPKARGFR